MPRLTDEPESAEEESVCKKKKRNFLFLSVMSCISFPSPPACVPLHASSSWHATRSTRVHGGDRGCRSGTRVQDRPGNGHTSDSFADRKSLPSLLFFHPANSSFPSLSLSLCVTLSVRSFFPRSGQNVLQMVTRCFFLSFSFTLFFSFYRPVDALVLSLFFTALLFFSLVSVCMCLFYCHPLLSPVMLCYLLPSPPTSLAHIAVLVIRCVFRQRQSGTRLQPAAAAEAVDRRI